MFKELCLWKKSIVTSEYFHRYFRRCLNLVTVLLLTTIMVPSTLWSQSNHAKFVYTLGSTTYSRSPTTIKKRSPDGSPIPITPNELGWLRVGSLLEVLERRGNWLKIRNIEEGNIQGWIQTGPALTFSDPRLYFQTKIGKRTFEGYCIFNVNNDNSGGYVNRIKFNDDRPENLEIDLSDCLELIFDNNEVSFILREGDKEREKFSGKIEKGDCYLFSRLKIKLNQPGRSFYLRRIR